MHEARAGCDVIAADGEDRVAESDPEHQAAVTDRQVRRAVGVAAVRAGVDSGVLDDAEQVDGDAAQVRSGHFEAPSWYQLARFAAGSSTSSNAPAGPLSRELGPGPWPN